MVLEATYFGNIKHHQYVVLGTPDTTLRQTQMVGTLHHAKRRCYEHYTNASIQTEKQNVTVLTDTIIMFQSQVS